MRFLCHRVKSAGEKVLTCQTDRLTKQVRLFEAESTVCSIRGEVVESRRCWKMSLTHAQSTNISEARFHKMALAIRTVCPIFHPSLCFGDNACGQSQQIA